MKRFSCIVFGAAVVLVSLASVTRLGLAEDLAALALRLESENLSEREEAVRQIGEFGSDGAPAVPAILCMLYVDVDTMRWFEHNKYRRMIDDPAIQTLIHIGAAAIPNLVRVLETEPFGYVGEPWGGGPCREDMRTLESEGDSDVWVSYAAFVYLVLERIGEPAIKPLVQALGRRKGEGEWLLPPLRAMGAAAAPAVPALMQALRETEPYKRADFIRTLGEIGPNAAEAVPLLRTFLNDPEVSAVARRALDKIVPN